MRQQTPLFYNKYGFVIIKMARDIFNMEVGDRLSSIAEYAEVFSSGRGTVQEALKFLQENHSISLEKQGPKGSFLTEINRTKLWEFTDWGTLMGAVPVPSGQFLQALITAINLSLNNAHVQFNLVYLIAAKNRLNGLANNRFSFVLTTRLAMNVSKGQYENLEIAMELPGCSYSVPFALLHHMERFEGIKDGMRIAVNIRSSEQEFLSEQLCQGKKVKRLEMTHQESSRAFLNREVDLLVIRPELFPYKAENMNFKIQSLDFLGYDEDSTTPVLVTNQRNYGIKRLLQTHLNTKEVWKIYKMVLDKKIEATFY